MMSKKSWKRRNVCFYLSKGAHVDEYDQFDLTPLFVAVSYGDSKLVRYLVEKGADVNKETGALYSPLHAAVITGQIDVCDLLIQKGAKFWTPIHQAAFCGDLVMVKQEYPLVNTSEIIWRKAPCIFYAIGGNRLDIVKWLIEENPSAAVWKNMYGNTPLMCTSWSGNRNIASYLVSHTAASTSERSDSKMTPLLWAALHGNIQMVEFLLQKGSSLSEVQDDGSTALLWAAKNGHVKLLQWLLDHGGCTLKQKTKNGNTPLLCAAKEGETEMVEYLLKLNANIHETNENLETALTFAASEGYLDLVRFLMEFGNYNDYNLQVAMEKAVDPQMQLCISYYQAWRWMRYLFIGHVDFGSPLSELPKELIVQIARFLS